MEPTCTNILLSPRPSCPTFLLLSTRLRDVHARARRRLGVWPPPSLLARRRLRGSACGRVCSRAAGRAAVLHPPPSLLAHHRPRGRPSSARRRASSAPPASSHSSACSRTCGRAPSLRQLPSPATRLTFRTAPAAPRPPYPGPPHPQLRRRRRARPGDSRWLPRCARPAFARAGRRGALDSPRPRPAVLWPCGQAPSRLTPAAVSRSFCPALPARRRKPHRWSPPAYCMRALLRRRARSAGPHCWIRDFIHRKHVLPERVKKKIISLSRNILRLAISIDLCFQPPPSLGTDGYGGPDMDDKRF
jgi:hypothetical protein